MRNLISTMVFGLAVAACGGGQKSVNNGGSSGGHVPPPPSAPTGGEATVKAAPRAISKDARTDFKAAYDMFLDNDTKNGWTDQSCRSLADKFASIAHDHSDLIEAQLNSARSYLKLQHVRRRREGVAGRDPHEGRRREDRRRDLGPR